jgi:integrase
VHFLSSFVDFAGAQLRIDAIEPLHVIRWVETKKSWNSTTRCDAISAMQRAFNWGVKRGQIARSPIAVVADKPRRQRRETVYSQNEWKKLRGLVKDQQFGDLLDFMRNTGCRPIEARTVCSHHVDLENKMVVFPPSEAKGERNERVVFLPDEAVEICKRLVRGDSADPILLNIKGRPWTKDAINCRFRRLREKLSIGACAYAVRHTYATEALKKGIDSLTLAQIMGHSDTSMLAKHYAHLARNPDYLREQASKAAS